MEQFLKESVRCCFLKIYRTTFSEKWHSLRLRCDTDYHSYQVTSLKQIINYRIPKEIINWVELFYCKKMGILTFRQLFFYHLKQLFKVLKLIKLRVKNQTVESLFLAFKFFLLHFLKQQKFFLLFFDFLLFQNIGIWILGLVWLFWKLFTWFGIVWVIVRTFLCFDCRFLCIFYFLNRLLFLLLRLGLLFSWNQWSLNRNYSSIEIYTGEWLQTF
jgi:hypothetical protein